MVSAKVSQSVAPSPQPSIPRALTKGNGQEICATAMPIYDTVLSKNVNLGHYGKEKLSSIYLTSAIKVWNKKAS